MEHAGDIDSTRVCVSDEWMVASCPVLTDM